MAVAPGAAWAVDPAPVPNNVTSDDGDGSCAQQFTGDLHQAQRDFILANDVGLGLQAAGSVADLAGLANESAAASAQAAGLATAAAGMTATVGYAGGPIANAAAMVGSLAAAGGLNAAAAGATAQADAIDTQLAGAALNGAGIAAKIVGQFAAHEAQDIAEQMAALPNCEATFTGTVTAQSGMNVTGDSYFADNVGVEGQIHGGDGISAHDGQIVVGNLDGDPVQPGVALGGGALSGAGTPGQEAVTGHADAVAIGNNAEATSENSTALGTSAYADGVGASAIGANSTAEGTNATAVGTDSTANSNHATAVGSNASATGVRSSALGRNARANKADATAIGSNSDATGEDSTAVGTESEASGYRSLALGAASSASASHAVAIGGASASGAESIAVGAGASAYDMGSTAVGRLAYASSGGAAFGDLARAEALGSSAYGPNAHASGSNSSAFGAGTRATGSGSVAIGTDSSGNGAVAALPDQFVLGTSNHTYTAPGIGSALSKSRQSGPVNVVTNDAQGNLADDGGEIFRRLDEHETGIAMAIAMENPSLVQGEKFGIAAAWGHFEGGNALSASVMGVLGENLLTDGDRLAVFGGVGVGFENGRGDATLGGRAGFQWTY